MLCPAYVNLTNVDMRISIEHILFKNIFEEVKVFNIYIYFFI